MEKFDFCIHFLLGKALQRVNQVSKSKISPYGVTPVQYALLYQLWKKDGQFSYKIAERLHLDSATITGVIDRLEYNEFVKRHVDPNDRRNKVVFLTEKGKSIEEPLCQKMNEMNNAVMSEFDDEEIQQFKKMLFAIGISNKNKKA